jgi:hypothetical protein
MARRVQLRGERRRRERRSGPGQSGRDGAGPQGSAAGRDADIGSPDGRLDVGAEIVVRSQHRDGALLVMATDGMGLISKSRRSISGHVLSELRQPVLLVGPKVDDPLPLASPTLVVCTDRSHQIGPALPVVEAWQRTFGGGRPRVVEVRPTAGWPADAGDEEMERQRSTRRRPYSPSTASTLSPACSTLATPRDTCWSSPSRSTMP